MRFVPGLVIAIGLLVAVNLALISWDISVDVPLVEINYGAKAADVAPDTAVEASPGSGLPGCEKDNSCYSPYLITVDAGSTITWTNNDNVIHTVTAGSPNTVSSGFDSGLFAAGETFEHTFEESGTYPYFCLLHPWMEGVVVVG